MRAAIITILAAVSAAIFLAAPVPKWAGRTMQSAFGNSHPAVSCINEPEIKCTWEQFFRILLLVKLKDALPGDSGMRASLENVIDLYSNPYRQNQGSNRFQEVDSYFRSSARGMPRSSRGYRR